MNIDDAMSISAQIKGIQYDVLLSENLKPIDFKKIDINEASPYFLLIDNNSTYAVSKWVSPKRTRSYPYERVYNTLNNSKKITIIPIIKDEGLDGDRDYIQWDTVSLMSLLDVFVIFAYYDKATKNPKYENKITDFQFNNRYILSKIKEIKKYHSSALHWNLKELTHNFQRLVKKVKRSYEIIEKQTGVLLHSQTGIINFQKKITKDISIFMEFSREKAEKAQIREIFTIQPKEMLSTTTKAKITINNYLGGQYFFTVDEVLIENDTVYLIESKHSKNSLIPSKSDIKDGLLKMILFSNLTDVKINGKIVNNIGMLNLTSPLLKGYLKSKHKLNDRVKFFLENNLIS